jgi:hypothetical protein
MRGNIVGDEEFLAWEPFSHMAFRFNHSTSNALSAFAEDYRVVPTDERYATSGPVSTDPTTPNA